MSHRRRHHFDDPSQYETASPSVLIPAPSPINMDARAKLAYMIQSHSHFLGLLVSNPAFAPSLTRQHEVSTSGYTQTANNITNSTTNRQTGSPTTPNRILYAFEFARRTITILRQLKSTNPSSADPRKWDEVNARAVFLQQMLDDERGLLDVLIGDGWELKQKLTGDQVNDGEDKGVFSRRVKRDTPATDMTVEKNGFTRGEVLAARVLAGAR